MTKSRRFFSLILLISVIFFSWVFVSFVNAQWQEPTQPFPNGNPAPPVDTGSGAQTKTGVLTLQNGGLRIQNASVCFWTNNAWDCKASWAGVGGAVSITAGNGITVSPSPLTGIGTISINETYTQRRVSNGCAVGQAIRVIGQNGAATCETVGGGSGSGDITDVIPGVGISVVNSTGPQPSVSIMTTGLTNCGDATSGKVWWDGGKLMCGVDQSAGGAGAWSLTGNNLVNTNTGNVNIGIIDTRFSNKLYVDGSLVAKGTIYHKGLTAWSPAKIAVVNDSANDDIYFVLEDTNGNTIREFSRFKENGTFGVGTASTDPNYKITTNGGGIKAESADASNPAGYFNNTGGGRSLMTGSALAEIGGDLNVVGVYRKNGTAGTTKSCAPGTLPNALTVSGGIITNAGTDCVSVGGGTTGGSWLQSVLPNAIYYDLGNVGIGTIAPASTLEIVGQGISLTNKVLPGGVGNIFVDSGYVNNYFGTRLQASDGCADTDQTVLNCPQAFDTTAGVGTEKYDWYILEGGQQVSRKYISQARAGVSFTPAPKIQFIDLGRPAEPFYLSNQAGVFKFINGGGTTNLGLAQNGSVGVGTIVPNAKLEVLNTTSDDILKLSRSSSASSLFKVGTDGAMIINNGGSDVMAFKSGKVGIGTNNPASKLEIDSGTANLSGLKFTKLTSTSSAGVAGTKVLSVDANGNVILVTDATGSNGAFVNLQNITPGTQQTGHLNVSGTGVFGMVSSTQICLNGDCQSAWPSGGGPSQWQNGTGGIYYNAGNVNIGTSQTVSSKNLIIGDGISSQVAVFLNNRQYSAFVKNGILVTGDFQVLGANAAFTGNVGIGTIAPATGLHIKQPGATDAFRISRTGFSDAALTLSKNSANQTVFGVGKAGGNLFQTVFNLDSGGMGIGTVDTGTAKLTVSGNVGIGRNDPRAALDILGDVLIGRKIEQLSYSLILDSGNTDTVGSPTVCVQQGVICETDTTPAQNNIQSYTCTPTDNGTFTDVRKHYYQNQNGDWIDSDYYEYGEVRCTTNETTPYKIKNSFGNLLLTSGSDNIDRFKIGQDGALNIGPDRFVVDRFGKVGIGTVSPGVNLDVRSTAISPAYGGIISVANPDDSKWVAAFSGDVSNPWPYIAWSNTNSALRFGKATDKLGGGFTEAMRIMSTGNVLIATTSPDMDAKLRVEGYIFAKAPVFIYENTVGGFTSANQELSIQWNSNVRPDTTNNIVQKASNNNDFTLKKVGWYRINLKLYFYTTQQSAGGGDYFFVLKKNGTDYMAFDTRKTSEGSQNNSAFNDILNDTLLVDSDSNDVIKITVEKVTGANTGDLFIETVPHNYLSIEYLGSN